MNNELIEAAKAVIARWDSTDWKAAPTAEVMNRLRAALSAKPESECAACGGDGFIYYETGGVDMDGENDTRECHREACLDCSGEPEPAKLPEVDEWIYQNCRRENSDEYMEVIEVPTVDAYLQQLTAAHAAELAEKDVEIEQIKRGYESYGVQLKEAIEQYGRDMAEHKEKGRREALMGVPVGALQHVLDCVFNDKHPERAPFNAVQELIESARAAQQEKTK